jgi:hypothetical protein
VWLIREEHEKRRNCRQSQKGYESVTFPLQGEAGSACSDSELFVRKPPQMAIPK